MRARRGSCGRSKHLGLALVAVLSCLLPALAHAGAARPDPLHAESGCERYRGVPIGANDPTQQFELMVCTTPDGIRAKVQTSSLVSGWSVRQSVGSWDAAGQVLTLQEIQFLESRPEPGWHFCLIELMVLEKTAAGLSGSYVSEACDDRAKLELAKIEPVEAAAPAPSNAPAAPPSERPPSERPTSEPPRSEPMRDDAAPKPDGCACGVASPSTNPPPLGLLALLGLSLVTAGRHVRRSIAAAAASVSPTV